MAKRGQEEVAEPRRVSLKRKIGDPSGPQKTLVVFCEGEKTAAARRAADLETRHQKNGAIFPDDNPSSGMHRLIASVQPA